MTDGPSQLTWDVYVTAEEPIVTDDLPPPRRHRAAMAAQQYLGQGGL